METARVEHSTEMHQISASSDDGGRVDAQKLLAEITGDAALATETYFLNMLMKMGCIATKDSSSLFIWLHRFVSANLIVAGTGALIYVPVTTFSSTSNDDIVTDPITVAGRLMFCVYTPAMYIYISSLARCHDGIVALLRDVGRREHNNSTHSSPCNKKYPIKAIVLLVLFLSLLNVLVSIMRPHIVKSMLGVTHHPAFLWYLHGLVYFLGFGWLLPIPFVFLGCKLLTNKIQYLIIYIQNEFQTKRLSGDLENPVDLAFVMAWYDELYEKNRLLNQILSGIVTLTVGFLALATTCLALNMTISGISTEDLFWFISNFIILVATCYPVAELEIQNKLLSIELGALPMPRNMPNLNLYLNLYQTCTIKTSRSEFGIFVKGTKIRITFNALIRVGSITLSVIIFLASLLTFK